MITYVSEKKTANPTLAFIFGSEHPIVDLAFIPRVGMPAFTVPSLTVPAFMVPAFTGTGGYICDGDQIRRADRWRLLHDVGSSPYGSTPLLSWQPFGQMPLSAVELDVGAHTICQRHEKLYTPWEWFGRDGISILGADGADIKIPKNVIVDMGLQAANPVEEVLCLESDLDESASIAATRSIFAWLTVGGEGWGESERSIFEHR